MFTKNLKLAIRQLFKNRLYTFLNIVGLAVGISACWIIFKINHHEFSYEDGVAEVENTYVVATYFKQGDVEKRMTGTAPPLFKGIQEELTGWNYVVPVSYQWVFGAEVRRADGSKYTGNEESIKLVKTEKEYFEMFPYRWLFGNPQESLKNPEQVVLTTSAAKQYFPELSFEEMLGKEILYIEVDSASRYVSGIVADLDFPSELIGTEFSLLNRTDFRAGEWTNTNGQDKVYIRLHPQTDPQHFLSQMEALSDRKWAEFQRETERKLEKSKHYALIPLKDSHFMADTHQLEMPKMNINILYSLLGIGAFLLLLACINYINMSVALIPQRSKEIGVRKTMGCTPNQIIKQFLLETFLTGIMAILLSIAFSLIGFSWLQTIIPSGVDTKMSWGLYLIFSLGITAGITVLAGLYPAWLTTRVKTIEVFKNQGSINLKGAKIGLQKVLMVFQFSIAILFLICTIVVGSQLRHTLKGDLGFVKDAVVLIEIPFRYWYNNPLYEGKEQVLKDALLQSHGIKNVSIGTPPLSSNHSSSPFGLSEQTGAEKAEIILYKKSMDENYLDLYQMQLVEGRNIQKNSSTEVLINELAAKSFGFANAHDAIGKSIGQGTENHFEIVGVLADFHAQDFRTSINPLIVTSSNTNNGITLNIKLSESDTKQWPSILKGIEQNYASIYPQDSYKIEFYDETIEAMYQQERNFGVLINLATGITILISCLGLFGLATLTAYQKTKEIGVRKVLGASIASLLTLLSKDFVRLILIACLIAGPIAWWLMHQWLENFIYRVEITWWMFALAGFGTLFLALITVSWQSLKAALANPVDSLRDE